jgi:hypothetical protein
MRVLQRRCFAAFTFLFVTLSLAWASITGSISGEVKDPSGAVISGATVVAMNTQTGVRTTVTTDSKGFYSLPALPVGTYNLEVRQSGFKAYLQERLVIDVNSALRADVTLQLGQINEVMTVNSEAARVETESTQLGEVIEGNKITAVPLNGRSYTDLLALQPGVVPSAYGENMRSAGSDVTDHSPSGGLNSGQQSINGGREQSNGFMVNGSNVEEGKNMGAAVIPNLDSIAEFRIITNNFEAEYGNYSGGQINVATKSGTNGYHGDLFEFLRNTDLDAKQYFSPFVPEFKQNIFGGTFGGPIKKDQLFFFLDYQGTRKITSSPNNLTLPSAQDETGNLADQAGIPPGSTNNFTGTVGGPFFAQVLNTRLGLPANTIQANEPYYTDTSCSPTNSADPCVFPNGVIPKAAWSPVAVAIMNANYIPAPNASASNFNYVSPNLSERLRDDKAGLRIDDNTRFGTLTAYYHFDDFRDAKPYDAATVPGFPDFTPGRAQLLTLGDTKTLGSEMVNEFQFSYVRDAQTLAKPKGGLGVPLTSLGFTAPAGSGASFNGGIAPISPSLAGVPAFAFNNFFFGTPVTTTGQYNNTYQVQDNFTKIKGTHSIKFGGSYHYDQINERNFFAPNGNFTFNGSETGIDFADFLIGATDGFIQASKQILDSRARYLGLYAQDSWRVKPTLTLNYGLRYEISTPFYDTQNKIETIVPGEQSVLFPGAPKGYVVPGDPGIPRTLAAVKHDAFSPRLGLAYSPNTSEGFLGKLVGGPGKTSIRLGFGLFYTAIEDLTQFQEVGDAPYGLFWAPNTNPLLETPYIDRPSGFNEGQRFPFQLPPTNVSAKNPDTSFNWPAALPLSSATSYYYKNQQPYSEHYDLSIQRQLSADTVLTVAYVGTQGHRLLTFIEANPGNQALCLFLSNSANLDPSSPNQCGKNGEDPGAGAPILLAPGVSAPGFPGVTSFASTRLTAGLDTPTTDNFLSNPYMKTVGNSNYNSLQISLRHQSGRANFLLAYTYSKSIDNSSGLEQPTNVFDPRESRGLSVFDVKHNFVGSYTVGLPLERLSSNRGVQKIIGGWQLSGITNIATGIPIVISESGDQTLTGAIGVNEPNFLGGKLLNNTNPRSGQPYFNPNAFAKQDLGTFGDSNRRFFTGPGLYNFDMALLRNIAFTESKQLQLRFEAFNVFNHAQFTNPDGNISHSTFGLISNAQAARIMQIAAKFIF